MQKLTGRALSRGARGRRGEAGGDAQPRRGCGWPRVEAPDQGVALSWGGVPGAPRRRRTGAGRALSPAASCAGSPRRPPPAAPAGGDLAGVLASLDAWLARHRPRFHAGLRPGASTAVCDALGESLGRPLPAELRTLLARVHNGQDPDVPWAASKRTGGPMSRRADRPRQGRPRRRRRPQPGGLGVHSVPGERPRRSACAWTKRRPGPRSLWGRRSLRPRFRPRP